MTDEGKTSAAADDAAIAAEEISRLIARLQKFREEADYSRSFVIDESGAREEVEAARGLVDRVLRDLKASEDSAEV